MYGKKIIDKAQTVRYYLTPPLFPFLRKKYFSKRRSESSDDMSFMQLLSELESKGASNFLTDDMVKQFCKLKRDDYLDMASRDLCIDDENLQVNLSELKDNGFTVVKNVISPKELERISTLIIPLVEKKIDDLKKHRKSVYPHTTSKVVVEEEDGLVVSHNLYDGVIRIRPIESFVPSLQEMPSIAGLQKICKEYLGGVVSASQFYLDVKGVLDASDSSVTLHADSFQRICKVFIALEDITDKTAPFLYFAKSHKPSRWRIIKDLLEFSGANSQYHDFFSMYNIISLFKVAEEENGVDIKPERVVLKAGDAIIADTCGVHGATNIIEGRRLQLGLTYASRGSGAEDKYPRF